LNLLCASLGCLWPSRSWHPRIRILQLGCCSKETRCFYRWSVHRICVPPLEVKVPLAPIYGYVSSDPLCGIAARWPEHAGVATGVRFQ
jgi:hypothetical protein